MYVGATWSYDMRKNLTLTLGYDYYKLLSNDPSATYTHSIYRVGAKYRY
jgi:opacity protein-like surface antigen